MPVANACNLFSLQPNVAGTIIEQDEIVTRAVHFGEAQHVGIDLTTRNAAIPISVVAAVSAAISVCRRRRLPPQFGLVKAILTFVAAALSIAAARGENLNPLILEQVRKMPSGGKYSTSHYAKIKLQSSAHFESGKLFPLPKKPFPSFCSGATYLVFIRTIEELRARGQLKLDFATLDQLVVRNQRDGEGIWGRWNSNGPGTARLFHELGLGPNFDDFAQARPGDFMKIFWNKNVGRRESGHSTIFLGTEDRAGVQYVRYWSSNVPSGYGEKSVPRSKITYAIFSRLEAPGNLARVHSVPLIDSYLASLLRKKSNFAEATKKCGI